MQEVLQAIAHWQAEGKPVALATVIKVYGSAPRPLGAKMVVSALGEMVGSVSGGCVEGAVAQAALEVMNQRSAQVVAYGISDELAASVGLACGGSIEVLIEPVCQPGS
jgi:xanthine dehydrogenase accessory factor